MTGTADGRKTSSGKPSFMEKLAEGILVPPELVSDAISAVDEELSLSTLEREYIHLVLRHENFRKGESFIMNDRGTFRGLGQFNRKTWENLKKIRPSNQVIGQYDVNVCTPFYDICAIVLLARDNVAVFKRQFNTSNFPNKEIMYLYHNQGAGHARRYLRGTGTLEGNQSLAAKKLFASIDRRIYAA